MARIVLTTYGLSGDLNPIVALGLGLRARRHDVLIAVEEVRRTTVAVPVWSSPALLLGNKVLMRGELYGTTWVDN